MTTHTSTAPCCLPNEILTSQAGLSWTIETTHHINCTVGPQGELTYEASAKGVTS
jgi:hypothetical protein